MVIRPRTSGYAAISASSSLSGTPDFDSSPERLTSTSAGISRRLAADSVEREGTRSQSPLITFSLWLCRWPMKCQRNASPWAACFASRSWARFSPTTSIPASARAPSSSTETYFVAATIVAESQTSSRIRSYRERISSGEVGKDSLDASRLAVAAMREEELGVARRAEVEALDLVDAGFPQCALCRLRQVEVPSVHDPGAEALPVRLRDLLPHLVAARADRGTDRRGDLAAERGDSRLRDAGEDAHSARVEDGDRRSGAVRAGERDRHAVCRQGEKRQIALVSPESVGLVFASPSCLRREHGGRVHLVVQREPSGVRADICARPAAVLVDPLDVVACLASQVERRVWAFADASGAGREGDLVGARSFPADQLSISSRAASSSDSRPSSSPFSLRRRSSARISPTRGDSPRPRLARSLPVTSSRTSRSPRKYACSGSTSASASAKSGASGA